MMEEANAILIIMSLGGIGLAYGLYNVVAVLSVRPKKKLNEAKPKDDEKEALVNEAKAEPELSQEQVDKLEMISNKITAGSNIFLWSEYFYLFIFIALFSTLIHFVAEEKPGQWYTTIAFAIGAFTSIICGYIGMMIATSANYRTAYKAFDGLGEAFRVAYHGGCVMGFCLVSISLMVLVLLIIEFKRFLITPFSKPHDYRILFEAIAGYGLGGSTVALFCRVGGGIYTKAADVGADLVAKLEFKLEEDDPRNPACIADNVGDNVGDIAGMGSDLFGSLAESSCAALLVASTSEDLINTGAYYYPLLITAAGILVCIFTTIIAFITAKTIDTYSKLENTIKLQMVISTVLMIPCVYLISINFLPVSYNIGEIGTVTYKEGVTQLQTMVCPVSGLISGLLIGMITEYYTSMTYSPVIELVHGCKQGGAINIILGLALGYLSNVIPTFLISGTIYTSYRLAGMFGISLAALGMLGNLSVCLAIDGYGPISDNAGGLATMCNLDERIRERTDDLDAAGNTTAAIGKGFAIGSACLVAFALYGAFVTRCNLDKVNLNTPIIFSGLLFGAMIPYLFSALTMKAVGNAAGAMVSEVRKEFQEHFGKEDWNTFEPNTNECINIATRNSLGQMFLPGLLVIVIPITVGVLFGPKAVAGLLIGIIISGIQMATSSANTGGAWDNCKKYIKKNGVPVTGKEKIEIEIREMRRSKDKKKIDYNEDDMKKLEEKLKFFDDNPNDPEASEISHLYGKHLKMYKKAESASITGDTVGDPMKDTSGPSLNILIKLSSIISVVFGTLFVNTSYLIK